MTIKNEDIELMQNTLSVLNFKVPKNVLVKLFNENKTIKKEVLTKGIGDTEEREMLLQAVLKELGLPDYPDSRESNQWTVFLTSLRQISVKFNIDISNVEREEKQRLDLLKPIHNAKLINDLENMSF